VKNLQAKMVIGPPDSRYSIINILQAILLAHDIVNLAALPPEIRGEKLHPLALQVFLRPLFSQHTMPQVRRQLLDAALPLQPLHEGHSPWNQERCANSSSHLQDPVVASHPIPLA